MSRRSSKPGTAFRVHCGAIVAKEYDLKKRTMTFALRASDFCETLPRNYRGWHVQKQFFRAATGTAAGYRAAKRWKSTPDYISKLGTAIEEADESDFWLEFAVASGLAKAEAVTWLRTEADELLAIFNSSRETARGKLKKGEE